MKKILAFAFVALLGFSAAAQEETPAKFKLYGFVRNLGVVDSRAVNGGTHDLYFYMPKDESLNAAGEDLNAGLNWKFLSLTTRLGLDFSGYKYGNMSVSGKVEADFYSLNGSGTANMVPQLRLRQAYMTLGWETGEDESLSLNLGQTWHPAADLPHGINLETCAPFGPFSRTPQAILNWKKGDFTISGGALFLNHFLPMDAQVGAKSIAPFKYGFPEIYLGVAYKSGPIQAKFGVDNILTKPIRTVTDALNDTHKASGLLEALTAYAFVQYSKDLFQLKAKATLAQSGEHMNMLSGYGISAYDALSYTYEYTPMQCLANYVSASYGKKFQVMGMIGYMKQLGTTKDLLNSTVGTGLWLNTAAATNIQQAVRFTPTVLWNFGKFQVGVEYDYTVAEFGNSDATRNNRGIYEFGDTHWIGNHRLLCLTKFNF